MRRRKTLTTIVFFSLVSIALVSTEYLNMPNKRQLALQTDKFKSLQPSHSKLKITEKLAPPVSITLERGDSVIEPGETFSLIAIIHAESEITNISTQWSLPQGIQLISSESTPSGFKLESGGSTKIKAYFRHIANVNQVIQFSLMGTSGGQEIAGDMQYHSLDQESIDQNAKEVMLRNEQYLNENAGRLKLQN